MARRLAGHYGGATIRPVRGCWVDALGALVEESSSEVYALVDDATSLDDVQAVALDVAGWVKAKLLQDAVLWSIEPAAGGLLS